MFIYIDYYDYHCRCCPYVSLCFHHQYVFIILCIVCVCSGDEVMVLTRTETQDDWWEGCCHGNTGIFPANYVHINT